MKILITGGGGYLGTVVTRLLAEIHSVRVLDRFSWGTQALASLEIPPDTLEMVAGDLADPDVAETALHGIDAVVHLAAVVGYPACDADPEDAERTNVEGTARLCEALGGRPLLFASTGSTYGAATDICTEESPLSPLTRYGRTKRAGEHLVLDAGGVVLRFATLFGLSPRMRWDLLPHDFARRGIAGEIRVFDGHARRTFLHVEDAASAVEFLLNRYSAGSVYNIGSETLNLTKQHVAEHVQRLTGCALSATDGHDLDGRDYAVSYAKIRALGWQPLIPFDLTEIVSWARVWR
jgi:nucleoside-diphosphate-sugar epimerase